MEKAFLTGFLLKFMPALVAFSIGIARLVWEYRVKPWISTRSAR